MTITHTIHTCNIDLLPYTDLSHYARKRVRDCIEEYDAKRVYVVERGGFGPHLPKDPDGVYYIKATMGTYGKSSEIRLGSNVKRRSDSIQY